MKTNSIPIFLALVTFLPGCCSTASKPPHSDCSESKSRWHSMVVVPATNHPPVHFYNKLNPIWWLGNGAEPRAPDWYRPNGAFRNINWFLRNPFNNFTSYVIGVADKKTVRYGWYPSLNGNPNSGWNFAVTRRRIVFLPFIDYRRGRFEFYLGWRWRGNFGAKLNFWQELPAPDTKETGHHKPSQATIIGPALKNRSSPRLSIPERYDSLSKECPGQRITSAMMNSSGILSAFRAKSAGQVGDKAYQQNQANPAAADDRASEVKPATTEQKKKND